MKVLIIGSGGREHALAHAIAASPKLTEMFIAPGNAGTQALAQNLAVASALVATRQSQAEVFL